MQELQDHYTGRSEVTQRQQVSRSNLNKIFYNNEMNFTFEKYVKNLRGF